MLQSFREPQLDPLLFGQETDRHGPPPISGGGICKTYKFCGEPGDTIFSQNPICKSMPQKGEAIQFPDNNRVSGPNLIDYTDVVFGLFWLLGYRFCPRIADIGGARYGGSIRQPTTVC